MWSDCPLSLELSHCFRCWLWLLLPECGWGHPLPVQKQCSPLGSRLPPCFDLDPAAQELLFPPSLGVEWVGKLRDTPGLLYSPFPSLPGLPGAVKLVTNSDFSHVVDELRRA